MIKDPFIKKIDRGEGRELILFSKNELNYKFFMGLPPILDNQTHLDKIEPFFLTHLIVLYVR